MEGRVLLLCVLVAAVVLANATQCQTGTQPGEMKPAVGLAGSDRWVQGPHQYPANPVEALP